MKPGRAHVRRREALRPVRIRHRVAACVDLDPPVVGIRPPRTPARAAQRRGLARVQDQVRAGVRQRQEALEPGVAAQVEPGHAGQRLEHPVRQASRGQVVVDQVQFCHRAQPVEYPRWQRAQRVATQIEGRQSAQACEVPGLERLDALVTQLQIAGNPDEMGRRDQRAVRHRRVVRQHRRHQRVAHLLRALADPAGHLIEPAVDILARLQGTPRRDGQRRVKPVRHRPDAAAPELDRLVGELEPRRVPDPGRHLVAEDQPAGARPAQIDADLSRQVARIVSEREIDDRLAKHRHRIAEVDRDLDQLAPPVGVGRRRRRHDRPGGGAHLAHGEHLRQAVQGVERCLWLCLSKWGLRICRVGADVRSQSGPRPRPESRQRRHRMSRHCSFPVQTMVCGARVPELVLSRGAVVPIAVVEVAVGVGDLAAVQPVDLDAAARTGGAGVRPGVDRPSCSRSRGRPICTAGWRCVRHSPAPARTRCTARSDCLSRRVRSR